MGNSSLYPSIALPGCTKLDYCIPPVKALVGRFGRSGLAVCERSGGSETEPSQAEVSVLVATETLLLLTGVLSLPK